MHFLKSTTNKVREIMVTAKAVTRLRFPVPPRNSVMAVPIGTRIKSNVIPLILSLFNAIEIFNSYLSYLFGHMI